MSLSLLPYQARSTVRAIDWKFPFLAVVRTSFSKSLSCEYRNQFKRRQRSSTCSPHVDLEQFGMLRGQDCGQLLYGGGGEGGEAVQGGVLGGRPGHRHLPLVVKHFVARSGTREEGQADLVTKQLGAEVEGRLEASQDLTQTVIIAERNSRLYLEMHF